MRSLISLFFVILYMIKTLNWTCLLVFHLLIWYLWFIIHFYDDNPKNNRLALINREKWRNLSAHEWTIPKTCMTTIRRKVNSSFDFVSSFFFLKITCLIEVYLPWWLSIVFCLLLYSLPHYLKQLYDCNVFTTISPKYTSTGFFCRRPFAPILSPLSRLAIIVFIGFLLLCFVLFCLPRNIGTQNCA